MRISLLWILIALASAVGAGKTNPPINCSPQLTCPGTCNNNTSQIESKLDSALEMLSQMKQRKGVATRPRDCADLQKNGEWRSGKYNIYPNGNQTPLAVICDLHTSGGGWTVFQRRYDGSVDFFQGWASYKDGFGNLASEFWLGNDWLWAISSQGGYEMRVDLEDKEGNTRFAHYSFFSITSESSYYRLSLGGYHGDAGNSLLHHYGRAFSTKDADHDDHSSVHCAEIVKGAWWHGRCHDSSLNGRYNINTGGAGEGIIWDAWKGTTESLKRTEMKIRPQGF